jgi:hypothetical protein
MLCALLLLLSLLSLTMSNHPGSAYQGKSGPNLPRPHLLIDRAATKSVTPKQKKAKIKAFLDGFRDQNSKCDGQNVEYGDLKTYLTQKQVQLLTC